MFASVQNAKLIYAYKDEFSDKKTGELVEFYRGNFQQENARPIELSVDADVFNQLEAGQTYDLYVDFRQYSKQLKARVKAAVPA